MTNHRSRARQTKIWLAGIFFVLVGIAAGWSPSKGYWQWSHGAALPPLGSSIQILFAFCGLVFGFLGIAGILCGLPRLLIGPNGIRLVTMFGSQWADWNSLAAFELEQTPGGRRNRRPALAVARIVGPAASRRSLRNRRFVIPDAFVTPLSDIVTDLNSRNPRTADTLSDATVRGSEQQFGLIGFKVPWVTLGILAVLVLIFACEQIFAVDPPGPALRSSVRSLLALGALNWSIVTSGGEWYRLLTAPLLHFDLAHIVSNGIALLIAGFLLERLVGRAWFLALFVSAHSVDP